MITFAYDSRSPFMVEEPPKALAVRLREAITAGYLVAELFKKERPEMATGAECIVREFERELSTFEAEMGAWQAKLQRRAEELAEQQIRDFAEAQPLHLADAGASGGGADERAARPYLKTADESAAALPLRAEDLL